MFPVNSGKSRVRFKLFQRGKLLSLPFNHQFLFSHRKQEFSQLRLGQTGQLFEVVSVPPFAPIIMPFVMAVSAFIFARFIFLNTILKLLLYHRLLQLLFLLIEVTDHGIVKLFGAGFASSLLRNFSMEGFIVNHSYRWPSVIRSLMRMMIIFLFADCMSVKFAGCTFLRSLISQLLVAMMLCLFWSR